MSEPQKLPTGWDEARLKDVLTHYDAQSEDEQAAEIKASLEDGRGSNVPRRRTDE